MGWVWGGGLKDYSVSSSPSPFPLDSGLWILGFELGFGTWIWDLGLRLGLENKWSFMRAVKQEITNVTRLLRLTQRLMTLVTDLHCVTECDIV